MNNSLMQAEQLPHVADIMDNSYLNNTATGLDTSLLREVQDTTSNLNASILSHGGGDARFYQPARGMPRGGRSGGPSLNNSYLAMDKSFVEQAAVYQGEAEEKEVVVEDADELLDDVPGRLDQLELARKLQVEVDMERRADSGDEAAIEGAHGAQNDFSYQYASPRAGDRTKAGVSNSASPSVSELVGQLTIRPRADLEDSDDENRLLNVKMISHDEAEDAKKADQVDFNSDDGDARGGAGPVFDKSMHKAAQDQRSEEAQTDLQGLKEMAILLADKQSKMLNLS